MPDTIDRLNGARSTLGMKAPARAATTANISLTGLQTIDGVTLVEGDRVLVKNQTSTAANGIYIAATSSWARAVDFDGNTDFVIGTSVFVAEGTLQNGTLWRVTTSPDVGVSALNFIAAIGIDETATAASINVLDYGADPTGASDSYPAFAAAALDYASSYREFVVPDGTYLLSLPVVLDLNPDWNFPRLPPPAVRLGTQAILRATAAMSGALFTWGSDDSDFHGIIIRGQIFGGIFDANNLANIGLHIPFFNNVLVFGVHARNAKLYHIKLGSSAAPSTSYEAMMDHCRTHRFLTQSNISGISKAAAGVVTHAGTYTYTTGDTVTLSSVGGMVEVNNRHFTITVISPTSFSINQNTTGYTTYTSGGVVQGGFNPTNSTCVLWEGVGDSHMSNCVLNGAQYGLSHSGSGIYDAKIHNVHVWNFTGNGKTVIGFDMSGSNELIGCQVDGPWEPTGSAYQFEQTMNNMHGCNVTYEGVENQAGDNVAYPVRVLSGGEARAFGCNWKALSASYRLASEAAGDLTRWASYACTYQNVVNTQPAIFHGISDNLSMEFARQNLSTGSSACVTDRLVTDAGTMFHIANSVAKGGNAVVDWTGAGGLFIEAGNAGSPIYFQTNYVTRATIHPSDGVITIGSTVKATMAGNITPVAQAHGNNTSGASYSGVRWSNDAGAPELTMGKSRGAAIGTHTIVSSGDSLGKLRFEGSDGTQFVAGAQIEAFVDGTPGSSDMPTRLSISITPDSSATPVERMRLDPAGNIIAPFNNAVLSTAAVGGFFYLPTAASSSTGANPFSTPGSTYTGAVAALYSTGSHRLWVHSGGTWRYASFSTTT